MSIESVILSNHFILCCPLLLLPLIFPSIRIFSSESALGIKWPKYSSFSFSNSPSNEYSELISFRIDWSDLLQSKNIGLGSHFLLLWATFYQVTLLWLVHLEWPCMAWLIASLSYTNPFTMTRMWSMNRDRGQGNPNTHLPKKNPQSNK